MKKSNLINAAMIGLIATAGVSALYSTQAKAADGECYGVNECKGKGDCHGKDNACAGGNNCPGKGWKKMSEEDCKKKNGKFVASGTPTETKTEKKK